MENEQGTSQAGTSPIDPGTTQAMGVAQETTGGSVVTYTQETLPPEMIAGTAPIQATQDPNRNNLGQFVPGNNASLNNSGKPCRLCENMDEYLKIVDEYIKDCQSTTKPKMPFIEEIALKLKAHRETVMEWAKNKEDHPEYSNLIYTAQMLQSLRLQQRVLGRYNPTGAISLLKWHHGMIETEKRILAGDKDEPVKLEVQIVEEDKKKFEDE